MSGPSPVDPSEDRATRGDAGPRPDGEARSGHGPGRPGGRTARNSAAVLAATLDELGERGYGGLSVDRIAARAGVHKATVYRRWGGVDGLLAAALAQSEHDGWAPSLTGGLYADLVALGREVVHGFTDSESSAVSWATIAAAFESDRAADALRAFFADRHERSARIVDAAIARGEAPPDTDRHEVIRAAMAPIYYRLCITREPVTDTHITGAARLAADTAIAGGFTR